MIVLMRSIALAALLPLLCMALPLQLSPYVTQKVPQDSLGFDYLHLVQEWPGSFCDTKRGCLWPGVQPVTGWLLHGLWPEFNNGSWPEYCDKDAPFNMSAIEDMLPELQEYWPSLVSPDQESFWNHEWTRHGTCAEKLTPTEHAYFRLVLNLREKFDVYKILISKSITPNSNTTWQDVKKALESASPAAVEVACNFDAKGRKQLFEVRSCYLPSTGQKVVPVDCINESVSKSCGSPADIIFFPPNGKPSSQ